MQLRHLPRRRPRQSHPTSRLLRVERLESRQLLSIANGVDYSFDVLAKAQPDQWYTGVGGAYVPITDAQPEGAIAKANQDYVWGMAESGQYLWFASGGNVLSQASGAIGGTGGEPVETKTWVAEYGESQYPGISDSLKPFLGDWRPPEMHRYNMVTGVYEKLAVDDELLNETLGIRSAGANDQIVLFAGPNITYLGMNVFAFNAQTGAYLGSQHLLSYSNVRDWVNYNGQLYTGVSRTFSTTGEGSILRWNGTLTNPFRFTEVGRLDLEAANLCVHEGRLYATTWPLGYGSLMGILGYRSDAMAGLWMSPALGTTGLTSSQASSWTKVWSIDEYESDPVIAKSYGGGALASFGGYLYWGTMQVPGTGSVVLAEAYTDVDWSKVVTPYDPQNYYATSERVVALFRGKDLASSTGGQIELLYGNDKLWNFVEGTDPATDPGHWELKANNMGGQSGIYGRVGFGNAGNRYIWTMAVQTNPVTQKEELYVGTFDATGVQTGDVYVAVSGDEVRFNTYVTVQTGLPLSLGADLWVFDDTSGPAEPASLNGVGNPLNHGVRSMESTPYGLFLGTANCSNLLTAAYNPPTQPFEAGGWELVQVQVDPVDPILLSNNQVAENSAAGTVVGTFSVDEPGTYTYTLSDNAGGRYQIVGNQLQVANTSLMNYENLLEHTIRVQATEAGGTIYERPFTIHLTNVNESPYNIRFSSGGSVAENSANGTLVGNLSTSDPDVAFNTYTYTLLSNADGRFFLSGSRIYVANGSLLDYETSTSHSILVQVTDSGGLTYQKSLTVTVTDVDETPNHIVLTGSTVAENSAVGTLVGTLALSKGGTYSYTLTDNAGGRFMVSGAQLQVASATLLDFETSATYSVAVQAVGTDGTFNATFTVALTNVNETPTGMALSPSSVPENSAVGTLVGTLTTTDPDASDTFTYTLVDGAGGRFQIAGNQLQVANASLVTYEANTSHTVIVKVTDAGGLSYQKSLTVAVTNVNEQPTAMNLSATQVAEKSAEGTAVGTLSTVDPDAGDTHSYALVDNAGGRFKLVGSQLQVANGTLLLAGETHNVVVRSTDAGALWLEKTFTITVGGQNTLAAIDVQDGMTQRSFIRYVDLVFTNSSGLATLISEGRIKLTRYSLTGGGTPVTVSLTNKLSTSGSEIRFNFGTGGIGGSASSSTGDGYYEIGVDLDRNGTFETLKHFYRLLGDVTGDRKVDASDVSAVSAAYGKTGSNLEADINGSRSVNYWDWYYTRRARGRSLTTGLPLDD